MTRRVVDAVSFALIGLPLLAMTLLYGALLLAWGVAVLSAPALLLWRLVVELV